MSIILHRLSATAAACCVLGVGLSACATDTSSPGSQDLATTKPRSTGSSSPPTSASPPPSEGTHTVSVSLSRTGGLKPVPLERTFSTSKPPPNGYTRADVRAVLHAADAFESADVSLTRVSDNPCCDQYSFAVTVVRDDGSSATYRTVSGQRQPSSFDTLLSELS